MERQKIEKIMEKASALEELARIQEKMGSVDIEKICEETTDPKDFENEPTLKKTIYAVMCGLVYWNEEKQCITQKLINPIKAGELEADHLDYKNKVSLKDFKIMNSLNNFEVLIKTIARIVGRGEPLIGQLYGQDAEIALGCLSFFDK